MLARWTELLPLFIVRRLALRCERIRLEGMSGRSPRPGVWIRDTQ